MAKAITGDYRYTGCERALRKKDLLMVSAFGLWAAVVWL